MAANPKSQASVAGGNGATGAFTITKDDTTKFTSVARGIYVGGTGDVTVLMLDGSTATFSAVPAGSILPIWAQRVNTTGTSASLMVGLL